MENSPGLLGIFAKYWQPGAVKTRLGSVIGHERASQLQRSFLETLLKRCRVVGGARQLRYAPPNRRADFASLVDDGWTLQCQGAGDLGDRLARFFAEAHRGGFTRAIALGADSPNVPLEFVQRAFQEMSRVPVVLGPSHDGGYYLLGIAGPPPPIFAGIAWGTVTVWRETVDRLGALRVPFAQLPPWYDVDVLEDLARLAADLATTTDPQLIALRRTVLDLVG